jgi:glycosyltransferase involved in cell wall biosynthesis
MGLAAVVPCLGLPERLEAVLRALPAHVATYVVDDGSDPPLDPSRGVLLRHERTRGYGAAQRTGYARALADGADPVVLVHGDGQYEVEDVLALADALGDADAAFGSRFLGEDPPDVPAWRSAGIRLLTAAADLRFGARLTDLHNGARAFRAATLRSLPLDRFPDGYLFDHAVVAALLARGVRIAQRPVRMTYGPEVRSIAPGAAVRYGLGCLAHLAWPPGG